MKKCTQQGCPYTPERPDCIEGKADCPHLVEAVDDAKLGQTKVIGGGDSLRADIVAKTFHTGEKLSADEASTVLHENPTSVVLCVGATGSGKTTFLARIGELFREGAMSAWRFAGSLTLCGFERASWRATLVSGAIVPDTRRTDRWENDTFLHLCANAVEGGKWTSRHILISDLSGESFPDAVSSQDFCRSLCSLQRADTLVVFADSKQLVDTVQRHAETDNVIKFLQQVESSVPNARALRVQVVFSRWDYAISVDEHLVNERYCEEFERDLQTRFEGRFEQFDISRVAARPRVGEPTDDIIRQIFSRWMVPLKGHPIDPIGEISHARDFSAYLRP